MLNTKDFIYVRGLFDDPVTLDIADAIVTLGVTAKVGETIVKWAFNLGDLGGTPSDIDVTPLASLVKLVKAGLQEQDQWELSYIFNRTDFTAIDAMVTAGTSQNIEVTLPNGDKFTNRGVVAANTLTGISVGARVEAKATINLSGKWTYVAGT